MIVKHPRIPNVEVNVPESDVAGWVAQGWVSDEPDDATPPAGNASRDEWMAFALAVGADEESIADRSRDDLRETYGD